MAIVTTGPIVGAISGQVGGQLFKQTRYGTVLCNSPVTTDRKTQSQITQRANYITIKKKWTETLTADHRAAWRACAANITFPNRLGIKRNLSGFQFFMKHNFPFGSLYPVALIPPLFPRIEAPTDLTIDFSESGNLFVDFNFTSPTMTSYIIFYGQRPITNKTLSSYNYMKCFGYEVKVAGAQHINVSTNWDNTFGRPRESEVIAIEIYTQHVTRMKSFRVRTTGTVSA